MSRRPPSARQRTLAVNEWNHVNAIGTPVVVRRDDGSSVTGKTTSAAYLLGGHTPVIHVDSISGCYALERVAHFIQE